VKKILIIISAENKVLPINKHKIGEVFLEKDKLCVQCGDGAIAITKLQLEGGKPLKAKEFLRGHNDLIGTILV
jgi:methionyl-tRNA formyltransferase